MATATYTCTIFYNAPKGIHAGTQSVGGTLAWGATSTVGDIGFLCKVPHGAKIVALYEWHTTGATAQALSFGLDRGVAAGGGGNLSCFVASGAQATMNRLSLAAAPGGSGLHHQPVQVSLSDLDPVRYAILTAKVESGTTTTSLFVAFQLSYRIDAPDTQ